MEEINDSSSSREDTDISDRLFNGCAIAPFIFISKNMMCNMLFAFFPFQFTG